MLKRNFAVLLVAGLVVGGAAVALAGDDPARPSLVAAARTGETPPPGPDGPDQADRQARREALRACLERAGEDRAARQACVEAAGPGIHHHKGRRGFGGPLGPALLGRAVHGTAIVPNPDGGWHEVTFDRGRIDEASDGAKVVLDRPDGELVTIEVTAETEYHGVENAEALVDGRPAVVVSQEGKALHVLQKDPERRRGPGNNEPAPDVPND